MFLKKMKKKQKQKKKKKINRISTTDSQTHHLKLQLVVRRLVKTGKGVLARLLHRGQCLQRQSQTE